MIHFLSATPGSGKSLLATELLYKLSKDNIKNLKHNYYYAKAFFEKIETLDLSSYLRSITITKGQGLERETEYLFLEHDYFDYLKNEYQINLLVSEYSDLEVNFPAYYFERSMILNLIIDSLNENEKTSFEYFKPVRTIYTNIADLKLSQARALPKDCDWRQTPQGSYFVIDEAQLIPIFSEEAKKIDPIVHDLTIHRHKGYDFLFITQDPSFVNKYIRKLASLHIHLINIFGWEQSMKIEWTVVQENPNAVRSLARAENVTRWRFPKHVYKLYKSSTAHTRKKRIPKKLVFLFILMCFFFLGAGLLFSKDSALLRFFSGQSPLELKVDEKNVNPNTTKTNGSADSQSSSSQSAASEATTEEKQNLSANGDNSNDVSNGSSDISEMVYDPSKPYDFQPVSNPAIVNHRVFSGCVKWQGVHYAYDQQGTKIRTFNEADCKRLIAESSNRPFDYFGNRQPPVQQQQTNNDEESSNYKKLLIDLLLEQETQNKEKLKTAEITEENIPLGEPKSKYFNDAAHRY